MDWPSGVLEGYTYLVMQLIILSLWTLFSNKLSQMFSSMIIMIPVYNLIVSSLVLFLGYVSFIKKIRDYYKMWHFIKYN